MGAPRVKSVIAALVSACVLVPVIARADWRDYASDFDIHRLSLLEQWRDKAVWEVQNYSNGTGDFNALKSVMEPQGRTVPVNALVGNWRCRNMKMGGVNAYIVYQWFNCSIRPVNGGLLLQKNTGTLRTQGWLFPENGAWVYLGASSARGEPLSQYSGRAPSVGSPATPDDQIGLLTGIGNNRLRLEIPGPVEESTYDIIEFAR